MNRRLDIWTRIVAALMLALVLVVPVAGPVCEAQAVPAGAKDCATLCAEAGVMPIECLQEMADGDSCGDMTPAPEPAEDEPLVSTSPVQAPEFAALAESTPVLGDGSELLAPLRASAVERPPLDPLGVRIRI